MPGKKILYSDNFQQGYMYYLTRPLGKNFDEGFSPDLTPKQMLDLGVFGGAYFIGVKNLIPKDLPKEWFKNIAMSLDGEKHGQLNFFKVNASQPLSVWQKKGWIHPQDPHGWFQWYCRYYLGRRSEDDIRQIKRWKAIKRHVAQIKKHCRPKNFDCRPVQRQALLHWAYDSRKF